MWVKNKPFYYSGYFPGIINSKKIASPALKIWRLPPAPGISNINLPGTPGTDNAIQGGDDHHRFRPPSFGITAHSQY
jgi:hypothetical protein